MYTVLETSAIFIRADGTFKALGKEGSLGLGPLLPSYIPSLSTRVEQCIRASWGRSFRDILDPCASGGE